MQMKRSERKDGHGAVWEFIRWERSDEKGRTHPRRLGRIREHKVELPESLLSLMTPEERVEAVQRWALIREPIREMAARACLRSATFWMGQAAEAARAGFVDPDDVPKAWAMLDALQVALRKGGHPRPKKAARVAVANVKEAEHADGQ